MNCEVSKVVVRSSRFATYKVHKDSFRIQMRIDPRDSSDFARRNVSTRTGQIYPALLKSDGSADIQTEGTRDSGRVFRPLFPTTEARPF